MLPELAGLGLYEYAFVRYFGITVYLLLDLYCILKVQASFGKRRMENPTCCLYAIFTLIIFVLYLMQIYAGANI